MNWFSSILTCACSSYANIASRVTQGPIVFLSGVRAWCILSTADATKEAATQVYVTPVAHCTIRCKPTKCCIAAWTCLSTARTNFMSIWTFHSWTALQVLNWMPLHLMINTESSEPTHTYLHNAPALRVQLPGLQQGSLWKHSSASEDPQSHASFPSIMPFPHTSEVGSIMHCKSTFIIWLGTS